MADDALGTKVEAQPAQVVGEISLATAETIAKLMNELVQTMATLHDSTQRANTATIAYMDRIILLAGGTLTLIFTVLGSVSAHLYDMHQNARHIPYVLSTCWLLVTSIVAGLIYNSVAIKLGEERHVEHTLLVVETRLKLGLLSLPHVNDVSKIPGMPGSDVVKARIKFSRRMVLVSGAIAQLALIAAFIFLASFIQSNISLMLAASPHAQPAPAVTSQPAAKLDRGP